MKLRYKLFQTKPTRFTLPLSIFISTSLHVSGNYVIVIRRTYFIYAGISHSVWVAVWSAGWDETSLIPTSRPDSQPYRVRNTSIDTISSPDDGHIMPETCREVEINILRSSVHLVGLICKRLYRDARSTKHKISCKRRKACSSRA